MTGSPSMCLRLPLIRSTFLLPSYKFSVNSPKSCRPGTRWALWPDDTVHATSLIVLTTRWRHGFDQQYTLAQSSVNQSMNAFISCYLVSVNSFSPLHSRQASWQLAVHRELLPPAHLLIFSFILICLYCFRFSTVFVCFICISVSTKFYKLHLVLRAA